jgi:hypothetical protein
MMEVLDPRERRERDYVPQAVLRLSPEALAERGAVFHPGEDDLNRFVVAEMMLDRSLPFALFRYDGMPPNETTIMLPDTVTSTDLVTALVRILRELKVGADDLSWIRDRSLPLPGHAHA